MAAKNLALPSQKKNEKMKIQIKNILQYYRLTVFLLK